MEEFECPACGGDGELATSRRFTCYGCNGKGKVFSKEKYESLLAGERERQSNMSRAVSAMEYRQMGG